MAVSGLMPIFAPMGDKKYYITAKSRLAAGRVQISGAMPREDAQRLMERISASYRRQRYPAYTQLRVEVADAVQLTIRFDN